ncbi:MAG: hypothetical protein WC954_03225, partial [Sphaerochaeta sp.]
TFQRTVPQLSLDLSREFPVIIKGKLCDLFREFYSIVNNDELFTYKVSMAETPARCISLVEYSYFSLWSYIPLCE